MEISLPDEDGRLQILEIHTAKMRQAGKIASDVNLKELAAKTKNFSGAEIEGLCRAAAFTAMYQLISVSSNLTQCYASPLGPTNFITLSLSVNVFLV